LDKNGKTVYFNSLNEINYESKFFIFNKTFYKEQLVKIFEENVDKINNTYLSSSNTNAIPSYILQGIEPLTSNFHSLDSKIFNEKTGMTTQEVKKVHDTLFETFDLVKSSFKNLKMYSKICDKIKENYSYQYTSLECVYKNISILYE
jgi:hypothetical protein